MKTTMVALAACIVGLTACKKDDDWVPPDDQDQEPETSLTFYTNRADTIPLEGVFVGITPNEVDRDNGTFLFSGTSNSRGKVTFSNLSALTYFWAASWASNGGAVVREGRITMEIGDEVDRDIQF